MDNNYLLTYFDNNKHCCEWFENENELRLGAEEIKNQGCRINEAFKILDAEEIEL